MVNVIINILQCYITGFGLVVPQCNVLMYYDMIAYLIGLYSQVGLLPLRAAPAWWARVHSRAYRKTTNHFLIEKK